MVQELEEEVVVERRGPRPSLLSKCPKTLYDLWKEHVFGFSGIKPAREFNRHERGAVRHLYSKRLVVWKLVDDLVRIGYTADRPLTRFILFMVVRPVTPSLSAGLLQRRRWGGILH